MSYKQLFEAVKNLVREISMKKTQVLTKKKLLNLLTKSEFATSDLFVALGTCLGQATATSGTQVAVGVIQLIVDKLSSTNALDGDILAPDAFLAVAKQAGVGAALNRMDSNQLNQLRVIIGCAGACGNGVTAMVDGIIEAVT